MRHNYFLVVLVALALAFSANSQQTYNLDPEALRASVMSEFVSAQRTQSVGFTLIGRRAVAPQVEPPISWMPCEVVVVIHTSGKPGTADVFTVTGHSFSHLPVGAHLQAWIRKPGGEIYAPSVKSAILSVSGSSWQTIIWNNTLPADWPEGVTNFEYLNTVGDWQCTGVARLATGGIYPAGDPPKFGPLEEAIVDSVGGVLLRGVFKTPPVVVAPTYLNQKVELVGDYYVPPGAIGTGSKPLGVGSVMDGNPFRMESSTQIVPIPVF